jgi:hypothetical protein
MSALHLKADISQRCLDVRSGQKRTFAVQENSDLSRRQTTMKLATDLPNGDLQHLREMTLRSA